jgi:hypothetical protein
MMLFTSLVLKEQSHSRSGAEQLAATGNVNAISTGTLVLISSGRKQTVGGAGGRQLEMMSQSLKLRISTPTVTLKFSGGIQ